MEEVFAPPLANQLISGRIVATSTKPMDEKVTEEQSQGGRDQGSPGHQQQTCQPQRQQRLRFESSLHFRDLAVLLAKRTSAWVASVNTVKPCH
ncbi:MAG UNVERIFIED_CONTAM: hypothetical protein LVR18_13190 [Planctomycetaceae bacterium]|jgi:hypothetical protein